MGPIEGKGRDMDLYKAIFTILEKKGQATIPTLWHEMTSFNKGKKGQGEIVDLPYLESLIFHRREWFRMNGDFVSIRPDRDPVKFTFITNRYPGPEVRVNIDFKKNTFTYFEWAFVKTGEITELNIKKTGTVEEFKEKLYFFHVWDWDRFYQTDGIIVDGTEWSVVLETKGSLYRSEGLNTFPKEWKKVCRAISNLTGVSLS
ncbi:hypothetical protein [Bacillus sp. B15-48]|uniref:hypothetical protein n=1 Tax=Bacillus sp. B15-48 TaxID=1548601 RepID=UPI00193F0DD5|nr:hypothetical protein [Bacillus sp. B15-48]MBM4761966.1 hypothetical protein [Bacillus sp. B15-48]